MGPSISPVAHVAVLPVKRDTCRRTPPKSRSCSSSRQQLITPIPIRFSRSPTDQLPRYGRIRRGGGGGGRREAQRRGQLRRPLGGGVLQGGGGHAPRGAPQLRRRRLLPRRRRGDAAAAAADQGGVLRDRPAAAGGVQELGEGPARVDQEGQRPPRHPRHLGWNDHTYSIDWPFNFHVLSAGCNHQCYHCFCPDVAGSCWRIPGYVLCLLGCSVYWSSISCCFRHFHHGHLSNCRCHDCYWLAWILLDDLVFCKEEHGPYKALDRHDKFSYPVVFCFSPCEAEAYGLSRAVIRFQMMSYRHAMWLPYHLRAMCCLKLGLCLCELWYSLPTFQERIEHACSRVQLCLIYLYIVPVSESSLVCMI